MHKQLNNEVTIELLRWCCTTLAPAGTLPYLGMRNHLDVVSNPHASMPNVNLPCVLAGPNATPWYGDACGPCDLPNLAVQTMS